MAEDRIDESFLGENDVAQSREGSRLFVDLGSGAGAVPVRADLGRGAMLRSSHAIVVAFMVVLSAGGIMLMRQFGVGVKTASADFNVTLDRVDRPKIEAARFETLMTTLESGDRPLQVDPSKILQPSPFELKVESATFVDNTPRETPEERALREAAEAKARAVRDRELAIERALGTLRLQSIVGGRIPAARVNAQIVRAGDVVADLFAVKEIRDRSVILECDGKIYELGLTGVQVKP